MSLTQVPLNPGSGGANIVVDRIGGSDFQIVKFAVGAEGAATLVSTADPMPVEINGDVPVTGPLTEAQLVAQGLAKEITLEAVRVLLAAGIDVNVTNAGIVIGGTVSVNNFPATQPISAVSLPLPANAAQETGGNLAGIKSNTDRIPSLGQDIMAKSTPVAIASDQSAIPVNVSTPTTPYNGKVTVTTAATRVQLNANRAVKSVTIKAGLSNSGTIYVGDSSVSSSNGFELAAGDTVSMDISNLNVIYIDASANSQYVTYIAVN